MISKFVKSILNEQYKAQKACEYIGNQENKNVILKKIIKRWLARRYHIIIGINTIIGNGIVFPHPQNIVIGEGVVIGNNAIIYQDVTIGLKDRNSVDENRYPVIHDDVCIYAGAKIIGPVDIADKTIIAANAVMTVDSVENGVYGGIPAKCLKINRGGENTHFKQSFR